MYLGEEDDDTHFRFNCFAIEDQHDEACGLENGELVIPGRVLRRDVFDPVIRESASLFLLFLLLVLRRFATVANFSSSNPQNKSSKSSIYNSKKLLQRLFTL